MWTTYSSGDVSRTIRQLKSKQRTGRALFWTALFTATIAIANAASAQEDRPISETVSGAFSMAAERQADIPIKLTDLPVAAPWAEGDPIRQTNPRQHYNREERVRLVPKAPPKADILLGFQDRAAAFAPVRVLAAPFINVLGQGFSGVNPPDTAGDVGGDYFIQAINGGGGAVCTVYKKADGTVAAGPFRLKDLASVSATGLGDPIVLYDHLADRWLLTEFARSSSTNSLLVYVSKTSDPVTGGWTFYQFNTPNFPDYPKYGLWHDAYYVTTNESDGPAIYALDRMKLLAGTSATMQRFLATQLTGFGFQALTPCDLDGAAAPAGSPFFVMRHRDDEVHNATANDATQDFLDLYELRIDWTNASNSTFVGPTGVPIAEIDSDLAGLLSFSCFPQKGSTVRLDPLREVIMSRLQYRNFGTHESIVGSFVTDVNGSDHGGVRWFEMRRSPGGTFHIHQEGTYAPDSHHRWMSSAAMDGDGNIAIAYNVTSVTMFPSIRYAARLASDPMGTMPLGEQSIVEGTAPNNSFRYGDYAALCVDPSDDRTFWFTGEYNPASEWSTRIAAFRVADETASTADAERRLEVLEQKVDAVLQELRDE